LAPAETFAYDFGCVDMNIWGIFEKFFINSCQGEN